MLLFLDVISPIPEFCVIDDNKIILQQYYKDTEEASQLLDFIMEKQEVKIKDNIRLKAEKKNE